MLVRVRGGINTTVRCGSVNMKPGKQITKQFGKAAREAREKEQTRMHNQT